MGKGWPFDIFVINVTGALVLAFVTTLADAVFLIGPTRRLFINVGFLGAYTTFSSLALGDAQLFAAGHAFLALLYFFLSLACGVLAVSCGDWLGQQTINTFRRAPAPYKTAKLAAIPSAIDECDGHIDVQDDVLLS
jgi:protein CrcB